MKVDDSQMSAYWETEKFWSGIHQQSVNAGDILGWDLWSLQPSGQDQGYQYMTVTLYKSFRDMIAGGENFQKNAKAAYPKLSDEDFAKKWKMTGESRDLGVRLFLRQIDKTDGDFGMPVGTFATMDFMQSLNEDYEKIESGIFKPWHQKMVTNGEKGSWGFLRILFPAGSDAYASHMTVNMYKDVDQFAEWGGPDSDLDMVTVLGVEKALESREMKKIYMARLEMKVRKQ
jgi:hypothetical protein